MFCRAFKGSHSYELQIGPVVFQVRHVSTKDPVWRNIRRFNVWMDRA